MSEIKNEDSKEFINKMLKKASLNQVHLLRSEPSKETKFSYHIVIKDEDSGRVVVALGDESWGDSFDFGFEIDPSTADSYL